MKKIIQAIAEALLRFFRHRDKQDKATLKKAIYEGDENEVNCRINCHD